MQSEPNTGDNQIRPSSEGISLNEFMVIVRRRRPVVLQAFVLITIVAVAWTLMTKPVYQSSARLLVEAASSSLSTTDAANPFSEILALTQPQTVDTQVQLLQSPTLAQQVQTKLGAPGQVQLKVRNIDYTNVIEVTGESTDPKLAAEAPNTLLELYIDQDVNQSQTEIKNAEAFGMSQELAARQQLEQTEAELEAFKSKTHVAELETDRSKQVDTASGLQSEVVKDKIEMAGLQSQIDTIRKQMLAQPLALTQNTKQTNQQSPLIKDKISDLVQQRASLTGPGGFTDNAPPIKMIDAQLAVLNRRLAQQPALSVSKTIGPNPRRFELDAKLDDLLAQKADLDTQVSKVATQANIASQAIGHYAGWEVLLDRLNRLHDQASDQDKMLSSQLAELSLREKAHHPTARIEEVAQTPTEPVRPKKALNIILGCFFGLFVGICLAVLQEYLDDRINTVEDANRVLGLPSLGNVPALTADDARLLPHMQAMDPAAESYRLLRTNIQFASIDTPIRTLLVTSSVPGEGKTTTAANLAFAMAMDGKKVIIVDTDLRRPSLHKLMSLPTVPGVTDVLLGRATLDQALMEHPDMPNLSTLSAGSTPPNPSELLNSRRFRTLTEELMERCDLVIFDSPPVTVASDAPILGSQMDGTVLVVEAGETRKAPARHSLSLLQKGRANILGVMYNKMLSADSNGFYYYQYHYTSPSLETSKHNLGDGKQLVGEGTEE